MKYQHLGRRRAASGNPLWADIHEHVDEPEPFTSDIIQIVGHTQMDNEEAYIEGNICLVYNRKLHIINNETIKIMIINKIIEKTYLRDKAVDGVIIFRPLYSNERPFKKTETYTHDSCYCRILVERNCYNRDGTLASKWNRQTSRIDRPHEFVLTYGVMNKDGQNKYQKYETELGEEYNYSIVSHEYFF